jgi:glyoxylase-like metal-dependent hydrolase (beta-lactamase superfamily II)
LLARWFIRLFWRPFEAFCHWNPLVPIRMRTEEVAQGIVLIRLDNFVTRLLSKVSGGFDYAVVYLVDRELLFDSGYAWASRTLERLLEQEDLAKSIRYIVNSHSHEDHCGNNQRLLELCPGATVYAHPLARSEMIFPSERPWYRRFLFGPEIPHPVTRVPDEITLSSGRRLQSLETPGHTPGHICLFDPGAGLLLSGDLYVAETLDSQLHGVSGPAWIQSLRAVLELEIETLLDGHGLIFQGPEARQRLQTKLQFLEVLRDRVHQSIRQGPRRLSQVVAEISQDRDLVNLISMNEGWMNLITAGDFSRSNLVRSFVDEITLLD